MTAVSAPADSASDERPLLRIIATCTDRKRQPIPSTLRMSDIRKVDLTSRFTEWTNRLSGDSAATVQASALYAGDGWHVSRGLAKAAQGQGWNADLWVVSAAYGLIPDIARIKPYAATFGSHLDAVANGKVDQNREWWRLLCGWEGPAPGPRSISDLAAQHPDATLLLVASAVYVNALADDLRRSVSELANNERLLVISVGAHSATELTPFLIPSPVRLQTALGGARLSLNARIARWLIAHAQSHMFVRAAVISELEDLAQSQPIPTASQRTRVTDDLVRQFVSEALAEDASATHTRLLRRLRDSGTACEQSRFAELYAQVTRQ